jgi:hypothetical protein
MTVSNGECAVKQIQREVVFYRDRRAGLELFSTYLYISNDPT